MFPSSVANTYSVIPYHQRLVCWYSADKLFGENSTLPADASAISFVSDLSGNQFHLVQSNATYQPTFRTNVINGLPVMRFATSQLLSNGLSNNRFVTQTISASSIMMFAVAISTVQNVFSTIMYTSTGTSSPPYRAAIYFLSNAFATGGRRLDADTFQAISGGTVSTGTPRLITGSLDYVNSQAIVYSNGTPVATEPNFQTDGTVSSTSGRSICLGMSSSLGTFPLDGDIAEVLMYCPMISTTERNQVELYLRNKYAIV